jgi:hypothetical protein
MIWLLFTLAHAEPLPEDGLSAEQLTIGSTTYVADPGTKFAVLPEPRFDALFTAYKQMRICAPALDEAEAALSGAKTALRACDDQLDLEASAQAELVKVIEQTEKKLSRRTRQRDLAVGALATGALVVVVREGLRAASK